MASNPTFGFDALGPLVVLALLLTGGVVALLVLPGWLVVWTPRWLVRRASIAFLWTLLGVYLVAAPAVLCVGVCSLLRAGRAWRRRDRAAFFRAFRWVLLASSCFAGLIVMELASAAKLRMRAAAPELPTPFRAAAAGSRLKPTTPPRREPENGATGDSRPKSGQELVSCRRRGVERSGRTVPPLVVGRSNCRLAARASLPGPEDRGRCACRGGLCLEQAVLLLSDLKRRPDAVIVFSGQNEFQMRFGWSRNVRHYIEEGPQHPLALIELVRHASAVSKLILDTLDRYRGETPAPCRVTRELVDHPICSPEEYAFLLDDYHRRLDHLTAYCRQIGTLPILIVPASNDGAYEPSRSVLVGHDPRGKAGGIRSRVSGSSDRRVGQQ